MSREGGVQEKEERRVWAFWFVWILKLAAGECGAEGSHPLSAQAAAKPQVLG